MPYTMGLKLLCKYYLDWCYHIVTWKRSENGTNHHIWRCFVLFLQAVSHQADLSGRYFTDLLVTKAKPCNDYNQTVVPLMGINYS